MGEAFIRNRVRSRMPKFTYTGSCTLIDDEHGNWRIKFLSSGTLTFRTNTGINHGIDVFLVGGGGRGAELSSAGYYGNVKCGGGGGYTRTQKSVTAAKNTNYSITIGGSASASKAFGYTANGGSNATTGHVKWPDGSDHWSATGGDGGSGGGGGNQRGGSDGTDGSSYSSASMNAYGGTGQHTTTREFGESGGTLYASGGGSNTGGAGAANTGNGGYGSGNSGGSGIVVIRNHR